VGRASTGRHPEWLHRQRARDPDHAARRSEIRPQETGQSRYAEPGRAALEDPAREIRRRDHGIRLAYRPPLVAASRERGNEAQAVVDLGKVLVARAEQSRQAGDEREGVPEPARAHTPLGALGLRLLQEALHATDRPGARLADRGAGPDPSVLRVR